MPIGMTKPLTKRQREDRLLVRYAWNAISSAMGWNKDYPALELWESIRIRKNYLSVEEVSKADEKLARKLHQNEVEHVEE